MDGITPQSKAAIAGTIIVALGADLLAHTVYDKIKKNKRLVVLSTLLLVSIGVAITAKTMEG